MTTKMRTTMKMTTSTTTTQMMQEDCPMCKSIENCRCLSYKTPGRLPRNQTPKIVMLTFDDNVNGVNNMLFKELLDGRLNPNKCPITTTFFVSDIGTNYAIVKNLHMKGHEMAVHTISHRTPSTWWKNAAEEELVEEIVGMKKKLEKAGIDNVVGYRNPFLQTAGDRTFKVLYENGFLYDSTLPAHNGKP
uniref:NodB homology domain-containing protein n=2 Tax=Clytia hemisphaerica TaxID=252671 RepID=A0A7M5V0B3_9CNID